MITINRLETCRVVPMELSAEVAGPYVDRIVLRCRECKAVLGVISDYEATRSRPAFAAWMSEKNEAHGKERPECGKFFILGSEIPVTQVLVARDCASETALRTLGILK